MGLNSEFQKRRNFPLEHYKRLFLQDTLYSWNKNNVTQLIAKEKAIADIR